MMRGPVPTRGGTRSHPTAGAAPAVVVGIDNITGLQTARILDARGVPVIGVASDRRHWGAHTRACAEIVEAPLADAGLLAALTDLSRRRPGPAVLFPCTDLSVAFLSRNRDALPETFVLPLAPHPVVDLLMDKVNFAEHATLTGLPAPRATTIHDADEAAAAAASFEFPCVLKPALKSAGWTEHTGAKGFLVQDRDEFLARYDEVASWSPDLLLQEWVGGPESDQYTCNAYFGACGEPLVTFVTRKVRQWPPQIGTGSSGVECRNDEILATTIRVFGDLGFRGLAYLEMKRDPRTGRLTIIEPNVGRPTGRSATAEAAGVDLIYTAYQDALGLPLPESRTQRYRGVIWVDLRRDAQAALVARRRGTLRLGEWARWLRGPKAHAIWSRRDPAPFAVDLAQASRTGGRMLAARLAARWSRRERAATTKPSVAAGDAVPRQRTAMESGRT